MAKRQGVRQFVFASSCSVYGSAEDAPRTESSTLDPLTAYARSKVYSEEALEALAGEGFQVTCLRFATACGMSERLRLDLVLNDFVAGALTAGKITILSDGTPWRPLIHVRDVCRVAQTILAAPRELIHNVSMNVSSSDENYRIRDVAEIVHRAVPGSELTFAEGAGPDLRNYRVDGSLLARLLPDAVPQWTVADGVRELLEWFGTHGLTEDALRGPRFTRLARIRELTDAGRLDGHLRWTDAG